MPKGVMHGQGGVHGRGACVPRGVCVAGGHAWWGVCVAGETASEAGGTHPTGMHSCLLQFVKTAPCCYYFGKMLP